MMTGVLGNRLRAAGVSAAVVLVAALAAASGAPADTATPIAPTSTAACDPTTTCQNGPADQILSNETTFTTWSSMLSPSAVRQDTSSSSRQVGSLHANTEDGFPEVYIVLRQRQVGAKTWDQVRLPKPAGAIGWVPRDALDAFDRITTQLVLNLAARRIRLYDGGRKVFEAPAAIGAPGTPTPAGHFWIREAFPVRGVGAYGPFAFGTSAYSRLTDWPGGGVVGLHGTNQPRLVPGRPSHGCVRLRNADILRLSRLVSVGTPLLVQ